MKRYYDELINRKQYKAAFLYLYLLMVCQKTGSCTTGRLKLSTETGIHESSINRYLKQFVSEQVCEQDVKLANSTISITLHKRYGESEQDGEHIIYYYINRDKKKERISVPDYYKNEIENNSKERYISLYTSFYKLLTGSNTGVCMDTLLKLKPVSYVQFTKLYEKVKEINGSRVGDNKVKLSLMLDSMYNTPKYTKGKVSLYLTLNNWLNLETKRR